MEFDLLERFDKKKQKQKKKKKKKTKAKKKYVCLIFFNILGIIKGHLGLRDLLFL